MRRAELPLLALLLLAGCVAPAVSPPAEPLALAAPARPIDWSPGNWWAYHADIQGTPIDVALVLHEAGRDGYRLGSNLSVGFFGLPFHGELTRERNPRIGPEVWPLFEFPLAPGKEWSYQLGGYDAKSLVRAHPSIEGAFELEARAFGQTFARYDFVPEVGWFTRLDLVEPTNGTLVLTARLTAFGPDWGEAYFVEQTLEEARVDYPTVPGALAVDVPEGFLQVRVELTAASRAGALTAELLDEEGRRLLQAQALARGTHLARLALRPEGAMSLRLEHAGAGLATVHLLVTGLSATGPLAPPVELPPTLAWDALLQSTRPVVPHEGHVTSTGLPIGV